MDNIQDKLIKKIIFFTAFQFLKTLILTILFFIIFQQILVKHVDSISRFLKSFNIESTTFSALLLNRSKNINGKQDELDELCNSINTITERIVRNNGYKNQIIKKQENEIVFKNTIEKNELYLKKFSNMNSIFDNELRNTFALINKSFDALTNDIGKQNPNLDYLKRECQKIQILFKSGQYIGQYRNEIKGRFTLSQITTMLTEEKYRYTLEASAQHFNNEIVFNMKRLQQCLGLIKNELSATVSISIVNERLLIQLSPKETPTPSQFELSLISNEESYFGLVSLIAQEENWKLIIEEDKLNFIV